MYGIYLLFLLTCLLVHLCPPPFFSNLKSLHSQETGTACFYADPILVRRRSCRMSTAHQSLEYNAFPCVTCCTLCVCARRFLLIITAISMFPCPATGCDSLCGCFFVNKCLGRLKLINLTPFYRRLFNNWNMDFTLNAFKRKYMWYVVTKFWDEKYPVNTLCATVVLSRQIVVAVF